MFNIHFLLYKPAATIRQYFRQFALRKYSAPALPFKREIHNAKEMRVQRGRSTYYRMHFIVGEASPLCPILQPTAKLAEVSL